MSGRAAVVAVAALAFTACNSARKLETSKAEVPTCTRCHGDPVRPDGSPPRDTRGGTDTAGISVGAHQSHLTGSHGIAKPVPCEACHVVPSSTAGHPDGKVEVTFGAVARPNGTAASWDRGTATCSVYCHGKTLRGGDATAPVWTKVDGTQVACGGCHGLPPPSPHPQRTDCHACHPATVDASGAIDVAGGRHVDGIVERELHGCTDCHGDGSRDAADPLLRAAPPFGPEGERDTTELAVGAHAAHLQLAPRPDGLPPISQPIACGECHAVPTSLEHSNGVADVAFGALATKGGALAPAWDPAAATCATTYCHGATLPGGDRKRPVWTQVDGTQRRCDGCHGAPPPAPHPPSTACATCHPGTVRADGSIIVENGLHLNGAVDAEHYHPSGWSDPSVHGRAANAGLATCRACHGDDLGGGAVGVSCDACHTAGWRSTCTFCHGDPNRATAAAAPPFGTQGEISPTTRAVGAHQAHLQDGPLRSALACADCHPVPADLSHVDGTRDLAFGELAKADGASPSFDGATCSSTYCHGATLGANGSNTAPAWTGGASQVECGTCHGAPPPAPHVQLTACQLCHAGTAISPTQIDVAGGKHVDGIVEATPYHPAGWSDPDVHGRAALKDLSSCKGCHGEALDGGPALVSCDACHGAGWKSDCTFCHGDRTRATAPAAPPRGTQGETATTARAVGAHQTHLAGGPLASPVACGECHAVPTDLSHLDGAPAVKFGPLASTGGLAPRWDGQGCSAVYCHGASLPGGSDTTPLWTKVDGTQDACGTCHARPPVDGPDVLGYPAHKFHTYRKSLDCSTCHDGYGQTWVDPATHANGVRDVRVRYLACVPAGCDPTVDAVCACTQQVATVAGWDCGGCHSKFGF